MDNTKKFRMDVIGEFLCEYDPILMRFYVNEYTSFFGNAPDWILSICFKEDGTLSKAGAEILRLCLTQALCGVIQLIDETPGMNGAEALRKSIANLEDHFVMANKPKVDGNPS